MTLIDVRRLLDKMAEWRVLVPLEGAAQARYERLCEFEERMLYREEQHLNRG